MIGEKFTTTRALDGNVQNLHLESYNTFLFRVSTARVTSVIFYYGFHCPIRINFCLWRNPLRKARRKIARPFSSALDRPSESLPGNDTGVMHAIVFVAVFLCGHGQAGYFAGPAGPCDEIEAAAICTHPALEFLIQQSTDAEHAAPSEASWTAQLTAQCE